MGVKFLALGGAVLFLYALIITLFVRLGRKGSAIAFGLGAPVGLSLLGYVAIRVEDNQVPAPAPVRYEVSRGQVAGLKAPPILEPVIEAHFFGEPGARAWIQEFRDAEFAGPGGEVVGLSEFEPTREDALRGARHAAREKIRRLVESRFEEQTRGRIDRGAASEWLEASLARFLADPRAEKDRFEDKVKLPESGETVYRAAVLFEVPAKRVRALAESALKDLEAARSAEVERRTHLGWTLVSALLLALVTYIVYSFLNAGSKGHLAWTLRIASIAAYLLVCLGLVFLRGHLP